ALALGLALFGAAQEGPIAALLFAGSAAVHPMGAVAGVLAFCTKRTFCTKRAWVAPLSGVAGLAAVAGVLAIFGPALSARETHWLRDYAATQGQVGSGWLADPATMATALPVAGLWSNPDCRPAAIAAWALR